MRSASSSSRLVLRAPRKLILEPLPPHGLNSEDASEINLQVLACGLCRTDAKMWALGEEGQPDLRLPRVLGHEIAGTWKGQMYVPWPGSSCGNCSACRGGAEHLCLQMQILGFHRDGGLASHVRVSLASLLPVPSGLTAELATLTEPLGCAIHALELAAEKPCRENETSEKSLLVLGGGTLGVLTALASQKYFSRVVVVEPEEEKLTLCQRRWSGSFSFLSQLNDVEDPFHVVLNATSAPSAWKMGLDHLAPRGTFLHFSGLPADATLSPSWMNTFHYRELRLLGAYGCTRGDMAKALSMISERPSEFEKLIEKRVTLSEVPAVLGDVLSGRGFRIIFKNGETGGTADA